MSWSSALRIATLVALTLFLGACGFHLRDRANLPFDTLYVEGGTFIVDLKRAIGAGSSARVVPGPVEAHAVLRISGESREKRILTLAGSGRVQEYRLVYRVEFQLRDRQNRDLLPTQNIELHRDMAYDDTLILAKESEEALLYKEMQRDAISQILRRLNAAKLPPPVTVPED